MSLQPNTWYSVLPASLLSPGGVYACRIHESEVVLWRDDSGCPQAARDIHPDRAEPLRPKQLKALVRAHAGEPCQVSGGVRYAIPEPGALAEHRVQQLPIAEGFDQLWLWSGPAPARAEGVLGDSLGSLGGAPT